MQASLSAGVAPFGETGERRSLPPPTKDTPPLVPANIRNTCHIEAPFSEDLVYLLQTASSAIEVSDLL